MSKIKKISSSRDKLIDQLINDKNRIYMKFKKAEKTIDVYKSQIDYWKIRYNIMKKRLEERLNEERDNRTKEQRSGDSKEICRS